MITSEMITDYVNSYRKEIDEWWALPDHHFSPKIQEHRQKMRFDSWWYKNRARVEKRNLHSFSGLYKTSLGPKYYRERWKFRQMFQHAINIDSL